MSPLRRLGIMAIAMTACTYATVTAQKKTGPDPALLTVAKTGAVLHSPAVTAIFWGAEWANASFAGDIVTGLNSFFAGYSNSEYAGTATEYYDKAGGITPFITYRGYSTDLSAAPAPGTLNTTMAIGEACKATSNQPDSSAVYVVFTSSDHAGGACGFHTWGTCGSGRNAVPIQVAAIPYASGVAGTNCDRLQDTQTGHSLALAAIANIAAHELVETITDPRGSGWRDGNLDEISDKCVGVFPPTVSEFSLFSNGVVWKLQGQWSNAAYLAGTGQANDNGQRGCIFR